METIFNYSPPGVGSNVALLSSKKDIILGVNMDYFRFSCDYSKKNRTGGEEENVVTGRFESISLRAVDWDMSGDGIWFTSETFSSPERLYKLSYECP